MKRNPRKYCDWLLNNGERTTCSPLQMQWKNSQISFVWSAKDHDKWSRWERMEQRKSATPFRFEFDFFAESVVYIIYVLKTDKDTVETDWKRNKNKIKKLNRMKYENGMKLAHNDVCVVRVNIDQSSATRWYYLIVRCLDTWQLSSTELVRLSSIYFLGRNKQTHLRINHERHLHLQSAIDPMADRKWGILEEENMNAYWKAPTTLLCVVRKKE